MSNAYINITAASIGLTFFPLIAFFGVTVFFAFADNFLAVSSFRRRFYGICGDRSHSLPSDPGKDIANRLRRLGRLNGWRLRKWRDLNHDAAPKKNRKLFFTIEELILHEPNEGSVKHFMFEWKLDGFNSTFKDKRIVGCEGEV